MPRRAHLLALPLLVMTLAVGCGNTPATVDDAAPPADGGPVAEDLVLPPPVDLARPPDLTDLADPPDLAEPEPEDPWYCVSDGGTVSVLIPDGGLPDGVTPAYAVQTDHYALRLEVESAARAAELGRMAEAAWAGYSAYFDGAMPMLANGDRLSVRLYGDQARWATALTADNVPVPAAGGIYWTGTKAAYLYRQPTLYFTDMLFLHEMSHQFHFLARTGNAGRPGWYVEGLAEYISRHDWDGQCLRIGRMPMLTQEDYPKQAAANLMMRVVDLAPYIGGDGDTFGRPTQLMVYRFFERARAALYKARWDAFRAVMDQGPQSPLNEFLKIVGDPDILVGDLLNWMPREQEPMAVIFLEWTHIAPGRIRGTSPGSFSAARVKAAVNHFEATFHPESNAWNGGVLVRYDGPQDFAAYLVGADNKVTVFRDTAGKVDWTIQKAIPAPGNGEYLWSADHATQNGKTVTTVTVNGVTFTESGAGTPAVGPAIYGATGVFREIAWK